ncbi:MAG: methyltransferase domain-containing protein [Rhodospirillaceae bacterium]|nr:MAG: methyltransferase domain-containing protein [Rhodospirillaceae bacterium]
MTDTMIVFDRAVVRRRRDRAAAGLAAADFLLRESAVRLADRLLDVTRSFPLALDLGCHSGQLASVLAGHARIGCLLQADFSAAMATTAHNSGKCPTFVADEESLPVAPGSLDLVMSNLSLHWVNDLPGALTQIRRALKPDGLFLATLFGTETLRELRAALMEAESETAGGVTPRVSPFVDVRDAGNLLTRAGFNLPVADVDVITVTYADMFKLMTDLRRMAETNAVIERRKTFSRRATFLRAAEIYARRFTATGGRISATFQIVTLTAWAPHESQPKPLRRGSATARLADALDSTELPAGDAVPRGPSRNT